MKFIAPMTMHINVIRKNVYVCEGFCDVNRHKNICHQMIFIRGIFWNAIDHHYHSVSRKSPQWQIIAKNKCSDNWEWNEKNMRTHIFEALTLIWFSIHAFRSSFFYLSHWTFCFSILQLSLLFCCCLRVQRQSVFDSFWCWTILNII